MMMVKGRAALYATFGIALAALLYLVLIPLVFIFFSSFSAVESFLPHERMQIALTNYLQTYSDPKLFEILVNTTWFTLGSTTVGIAICVWFAWMNERTNVWGKGIFAILILLPMVIPNVIYTTAWIQLINPNNGLLNRLIEDIGFDASDLMVMSMGGMILVQGMATASHAYLLVAAAFKSIDPTWEEQSAISGQGVASTFLRITLPVLKPALFAATIFFLIASMETFDIPAMLGMSSGTHVLSTRIYWVTHPPGGQLPNYGIASCLSMFLCTSAAVLIWAYERQMRHSLSFVTVTGRGYRPKRIDLGAWRAPLSCLGWLVLTIMVLCPLFVLVWRSLLQYYIPPSLSALNALTWNNYQELVRDRSFREVMINTGVLGLTSAAGAVCIAAVVAWMSLRAPVPRLWRSLIRALAFMPQAIPSIVLGFSFMIAYLFLPIPIYGTIWIIVLALITKYVAFASGAMTSAQMQISPDLEDASLIAGAGWTRTYMMIVVPLIVPAVFNCFVWVLVHAIRELAIALMLYTPGSQVLATKLWGLWEGGMVGQVSALGVLTSVFLIIILSLPALLRGLKRMGMWFAHNENQSLMVISEKVEAP